MYSVWARLFFILQDMDNRYAYKCILTYCKIYVLNISKVIKVVINNFLHYYFSKFFGSDKRN